MKFLGSESVFADCRLIYCQKIQRLQIKNKGRMRIALKQVLIPLLTECQLARLGREAAVDQ
jgi:hypothetical protein